MKWVRRVVVLLLAIGVVVALAYWWRNGFLADVLGPGEAGGHGGGEGGGRGGGLGLGRGRGAGSGSGSSAERYLIDFPAILTPLAIVAAVIVVFDMVRLHLKRARIRSGVPV